MIEYCQDLRERDFAVESEAVSRSRMGKREYLNNTEIRCMIKELNEYFESEVDAPLVMHGKRGRIETLFNEEALLLAKYLRDESKYWDPRIS